MSETPLRERDEDAGGVRSAEIALYLLKLLADNGGELSLSRLAALAGMPSAKAHRYMTSLVRSGFAEQAGRHGHYGLSTNALRVGLAALGRIDVMDVAAAGMNELRETIDQTVMLAIWGDHGPVVVRWVESSRPVTVNVRVGSTMPILRSATGRIFGAWMPWTRVEPLIAAELAERRQDFPEAIGNARAMLADIRAEGIASVVEDMLPGIQALGCPVFDADGVVKAALVVLGPLRTFDIDPDGRVATALRGSAHTISERLGFRAAEAR